MSRRAGRPATRLTSPGPSPAAWRKPPRAGPANARGARRVPGVQPGRVPVQAARRLGRVSVLGPAPVKSDDSLLEGPEIPVNRVLTIQGHRLSFDYGALDTVPSCPEDLGRQPVRVKLDTHIEVV